jgi:hypothetical protein
MQPVPAIPFVPPCRTSELVYETGADSHREGPFQAAASQVLQSLGS